MAPRPNHLRRDARPPFLHPGLGRGLVFRLQDGAPRDQGTDCKNDDKPLTIKISGLFSLVKII